MANKNAVPPDLYREFIDQWSECKCEYCWSTDAVQPHHIIYKSQSSNMVLVAVNIIPLCAQCHVWAHADKCGFYVEVDKMRGKGYVDNLLDLKRDLSKKRLSQQEIYDKHGNK